MDGEQDPDGAQALMQRAKKAMVAVARELGSGDIALLVVLEASGDPDDPRVPITAVSNRRLEFDQALHILDLGKLVLGVRGGTLPPQGLDVHLEDEQKN